MVLDGGTWREEVERWSDYPGRWTTASYTSLNRRETLPTGGNRPISGEVRPEFEGPWDALIVDEAHYTKNRGTNWTESVERLAKQSGFVVEMTGTPISHWAPDLYPMLRVMRPHEARPGREFGSYWRWVEKWFDVQPSRFGGPNSRVIGDLLECDRSCLRRPAHDPCEHYQRFMWENLGDHFLRRTREEAIDLPPITTQRIEIPMDASQRRMYRELKTTFVTDTDSGKEVMSWSSGSLNNNLMRLTTSAWMLEMSGQPKGGKFEQLRFDLANRSRPTLVLAHYQDTVEASSSVAEALGLKSRFIHGGTSRADRASIVQSFKDGKLDVLVGSLEVLAEGLTLTQADMAIFVEKSFKPSRNEQARQRIHRIGQERPVSIREYITPGTVDSKKDKVLATKSDRQMRMMSAKEFSELL